MKVLKLKNNKYVLKTIFLIMLHMLLTSNIGIFRKQL